MSQRIEAMFKHHPPKEGDYEKYEAIRKHAKVFAYLIDELCPESEEKDQAIINLQQAVFWANASISRHDERYTDCFKSGRYAIQTNDRVLLRDEADIEKIAGEIVKRLNKE